MFLILFGLSSERRMLYNFIPISVYKNHGTLDKFIGVFTPVIEYFIKMLKANQVSNINETFGAHEKMKSFTIFFTFT